MDARPSSAGRPRLAFGLFLLIALAGGFGELLLGTSGRTAPGDALRALGGTLGVGPGLEGTAQPILELRLWRGLTAAAVGASLALAGALLQGLYRNGLAAPSVLGVTAGAMLGGSLALVARGGRGLVDLSELGSGWAALVVPAGAFGGSLIVVLFLVFVSSAAGRVSVPMLLLAGVAANTCVGTLIAALQAVVIDDSGLTRALLNWTFGTFSDRQPVHVAIAWGGLALAGLVVPLVAAELDLFAGGEEDARSLGVNTERVKGLCIFAVCIAVACSVAVSGAIAFVGLVVPHLTRLLIGRSNRAVLYVAPMLGAAAMLAIDVGQLSLFGAHRFGPGVAMSMVGGPVFLGLLVAQRKRIGSW